MNNIDLYLVYNPKTNMWLKSKGYGGSGKCWVEEIKNARIYTRIGSARSQVTWWSKNYPNFGIPQVMKYIANFAEVIDETVRVKQSIQNEEDREKRQLARLAKKKIKEINKEMKNNPYFV